MAKKIVIFITLLTFSISFALPCFANVDPVEIPNSAIPLWSHGMGYAYQILGNGSSSSTTWNYISGNIADGSRIYSENWSKQSVCMFYPFFGFSEKKLTTGVKTDDFITFKKDYSYHLRAVVQSWTTETTTNKVVLNVLGQPSLTDLIWRDGSGGENISYLVHPLSEFSNNVSYTVVQNGDGTNFMEKCVDVVFRCTEDPLDLDEYPLNSLTFLCNSLHGDRLEIKTVASECYYDLDGTYYNDLVLEQFGELKDSINNGNQVTQQKLDDVNNSLNTLDQSVIQGNQQAHEDNLALQNKLDELHQKEKDEVEKNGDTEESENAMKNALSIDAFKDSMTSLFGALTSTSTSCVWVFPDSGNVPFIGHLWDSHTIDMTEWVYKLPPGILVSIRFVFVLGCVFLIIKEVQSLIKIFNKGDDE